MDLVETGEWAGLWWLPDDSDEQVPGVLRYDGEGGLSLTLIGAFEDRIFSSPTPGVTFFHEGTRTWDVIQGVAGQREISLLSCVPVDGDRTLGSRVRSPDRQIVTAASAIIGVHVGGWNDAAFSAAEVAVEDLTVWAASSVFEGVVSAPDGTVDGTGRISAKPVAAQSVVVDGTEYRLAHTHTLPFFDMRRGSTVGRMRESTSIRITPSAPFDLTAALKLASLIQDLIALAVHRAAGVIRLQLEVAGTDSNLGNDRPVLHRRADVIYSPPVLGRRDEKAVAQHRVFFTCESLPFQDVMPRWCEAHGRLQAATNMILGLRYAPARFIENNLLTAVGATEVLHRGLRIDERPFGKGDFTVMREAMLEQAPVEFRDRLRGSIRNDPTLRDRLYALAARPDQGATAYLIPDVANWARRTTRARNDLAHEGATPNHSLEELFAIVEVTTAIVILNVLNELGLPPERQREIVREHPQLRSTARIARDWPRVP